MHVDLNLLLALDALLEEGSVQGAAQRLALSPPALSRALGRIRRATGDEILVRTGRAMTPTPRALELQGEVHELVARATAVLTPDHRLDLATLAKTFVVRGHDALIGALSVPLTALIARSGPGLLLTLLGEAAADDDSLARGTVDLEVVSAPPARPDLLTRKVGTDTMVVAMRADHALAGGRLTPARFAAAHHVAVSRRGRRGGPVDDALAAVGLTRRIVAVVPTSDAALDVVSRSDAVAVLAAHVGAPRFATLGLTARRPPVDVASPPVLLVWHRRTLRDPANLWLRQHVHAILDGLLKAPGSEPGS